MEGQRTTAKSPGGEASARRALQFVVLLGVVSLFADMTYEGARAMVGPFLATLGASGVVVGFVAGFGELVGYVLRLASGVWVDKTKRYWAFTLVGYAVNLLAVPALALAPSWPVAACLLILERMGKALRNPARDVMLSQAASSMGRGWGFGLHEALDQVGAVVGPLLAALALSATGNFRAAFAFLGLAALLALATLGVARLSFPNPSALERSHQAGHQTLGRTFWLYAAAAALVAAGYADFPLIAFRWQKEALLEGPWIAAVYALAMGVDALAALAFGRLFDRWGLRALAAAVLCSAGFAPLAFLGGVPLALLGLALWGVGLGAQESVLRAAVGEMVAPHQRGTAYGVFNAVYGLAWFCGSALLGLLYEHSLGGLVAFSVGCQLAAVPLLLRLRGSLPASL